jgi:hypothetical protein
MRRVVVPSFVVLLLGLAALPAPVLGQIMGDVETVQSLAPTEVAPGQVFTIQGFNLFDPAHPELTEVRLTEQATGKTITTQALVGPSSAEAVYARAPMGVALGTWQVRVAMLGWGVSGPAGLRLRSKPGTPVPMAVLDIYPPYLRLTQVKRGQKVGIQAYGVDVAATGLEAQWSQPMTTIANPSVDPIVLSPALGTVHSFTVPTNLMVGEAALVQLRAIIAGVASDFSFALRVHVIE